MGTIEIALAEMLVSALILASFRVWVLPLALLVTLAATLAAGVIIGWTGWHTFGMLVVLVLSVEVGYLAGSWMRILVHDATEKGAVHGRSTRPSHAIGTRQMALRRRPLRSRA